MWFVRVLNANTGRLFFYDTYIGRALDNRNLGKYGFFLICLCVHIYRGMERVQKNILKKSREIFVCIVYLIIFVLLIWRTVCENIQRIST